MSNGDKHAIYGQISNIAGFDIANPGAGNAERVFIAQNLVQGMVPYDVHFGIIEQTVLHDFFRAELVAPMNDVHLAGEIGQEQRLFDRGVSAADNGDFLIAEEETIASRAGGDAKAHKFLFGVEAKPTRLRAGRDHHRIRRVSIAAIARAHKRPGGEIDIGDDV